MARSSRLRLSDERAAFELAGECRELGDDAPAWQSHLVRELCRHTGGLVGVALGLPFLHPPNVRFADGVAAGDWPSEPSLRRWTAWLDNPDLSSHPCAMRFLADPDPAVTRTRPQLLADRDWAEHPFRKELLVPDGLDEGLLSRRPVPAVGGGYLICLVAAAGDRAFHPRAGALVHRAHELLAPHLGRALLLSSQPNLHGLSPRLRQTLDCLLDGDGEKQAAARLGISPATIREYVTRVYRHFGVTSRGELLAHFLRRYRRPGG
jgi:DNA-binding CsgD family transcriptional regulator